MKPAARPRTPPRSIIRLQAVGCLNCFGADRHCSRTRVAKKTSGGVFAYVMLIHAGGRGAVRNSCFSILRIVARLSLLSAGFGAVITCSVPALLRFRGPSLATLNGTCPEAWSKEPLVTRCFAWGLPATAANAPFGVATHYSMHPQSIFPTKTEASFSWAGEMRKRRAGRAPYTLAHR